MTIVELVDSVINSAPPVIFAIVQSIKRLVIVIPYVVKHDGFFEYGKSLFVME